MRYINYGTLKNIMLTQAPYRGSHNRFPLGNRKQSYKYFLYEPNEYGEEVFRIIYGKAYDAHKITKEEYDKALDTKNYQRYEETPGEWSYIRYNIKPNEMGIVRADNTFEFTGERGYGQGEMMFLTNFNPKGYFMTDCKRGGMLCINNKIDMMTPIYRGLRLDCDSLKPIDGKDRKVIGLRVNRKESKEFLRQYEEFFKVSEAMMKTMPLDTFVDIAKDNLKRINAIEEGRFYKYAIKQDIALVEAKSLMADSPIDAAGLFCFALRQGGVKDLGWFVARNHYVQGEVGGEVLFLAMKRALCTMLYEENPEVMKRVEYEFGSRYPQSNWQYQIEVDGQVVRQF